MKKGKLSKLLLAMVTVAFASALAAPAMALAADVINVSPTDDLQAKINEASPGDTIKLAGGEYGSFVVNKQLTITAADPDNKPIIKVDNEEKSLYASPACGGIEVRAQNVTLENLVIWDYGVNNSNWCQASITPEYSAGISLSGLVVTGCEFVAKGESEPNYAVAAHTDTFSFTNNKVTGYKNAICSMSDDGRLNSVVITGNAFSVSNKILDGCYWGATGGEGKLTISNNTVSAGSSNVVEVIDYSVQKGADSAIKTLVVEGNGAVDLMATNINVAKTTVTTDNGVEIVINPNSVAEVGGMGYTVLQAAINAADGKTVTLLKAVTLEEALEIQKSTTINGGGYSVTSSASRVIQIFGEGTEVELSNLGVISTAVRVGTSDIRGININPSSTDTSAVKLTLVNCSVDFTDDSADDWAYGVNVTGTTNCVIDIDGGSYEGANVINVWGSGHEITIDGAALTSLYGPDEKYVGVCVKLEGTGVSLSVSGTTFGGEYAVGVDVAEANRDANTIAVSLPADASLKTLYQLGESAVTTVSDYQVSEGTGVFELEEATVNYFTYTSEFVPAPVTPPAPPAPPASTTVTIPVSGEENTVHAEVTVTGTSVEVKPLDKAEIEQIVGEDVQTGVVEIDLSGMDNDVTQVTLPVETLEAITSAAEDAGNDTESIAIHLPQGTVEIDDAAMRAVLDQAAGDSVVLVLEDTGNAQLNDDQLEAIEGQEVHGGFEAYFECAETGERIGDFKGGTATLSVDFEVPEGKKGSGFSVWYVSDEGDVQKMKTFHVGGKLVWHVPHMSDYVVVYEDHPVYEDCGRGSDCPLSAYPDVKLGAWYHDGLHWAVENGVLKGHDSGKMQPNQAIDREMLMVILHRYAQAAGMNTAVYEDADILSYNDAEDVSTYAVTAMKWAVGSSVMKGHDNGDLAPGADLTREQMATFLHRFAAYLGMDVSEGEDTNILSFVDALEISEYAVPAMQWACGEGVITGYTDADGNQTGELDPKGDCSRAMAVTMLMRFDAVA